MAKRKPKPRHDARNWSALRIEWALSGRKLAQWCRDIGLPYATARKHIHATKRDQYLTDAPNADAETRELIQQLRANLASKDRHEQLAAVAGVVGDIAAESHQTFLKLIRSGGRIRPAEVARIALSATEHLRSIGNEMAGMPAPGDEVEWPTLRGFDPHWYQRDFVLDFPSGLAKRGQDVKIQAFIAGIGSGKTRCGAEKWGKFCELNRGLPLGVYAPTYRMLEDVTKREFLAVCARKRIPYVNRPSDDEVILWGDTTVMFRSMDKPDRLRGPNIAAAWIDEALQMPDRAAFDVIAGRVRHPDAKETVIQITGTPAGFNWGYDLLVVDGEKNKVKIYTGSTCDNVSLLAGTFDYLEGLYDEKMALQELHGEFVDISLGRAYYNFERSRNVLPHAKVKYNRDLPLLLMCDFNVKPMHWVIGQSYQQNGNEVTYLIDEIYIEQTTSTQDAAMEFVERYGKHETGVHIYGDAAGNQRNTAATRTDYEIIDDTFDARNLVRHERHIGKSNPLHSERVKDVNARFRDVKGKVHLYVSDKCRRVIQDFERQGFKPGTMQLDKTDLTVGHGSDAVGYYVNREHAIRRTKAKTW